MVSQIFNVFKVAVDVNLLFMTLTRLLNQVDDDIKHAEDNH